MKCQDDKSVENARIPKHRASEPYKHQVFESWGDLLPLMPMLVDNHLLAFHIYPECAGVAPTHAVEPMQTVVDPHLVTSLDLAAVSVDSGSIVAGEGAVDDGGVRVNVVKVGHDCSPGLAVSIAATLHNRISKKILGLFFGSR